MKLEEVAKLLGVSVPTVRIGLQQGVFDFGVAFKRTPESRHYTYVIFPEKVKEYVKGETV